METQVTITFLANAGLLLQYKDSSLLIDALQESSGTAFDGLPKELMEQICSNISPFSKIDAILFTHLHPDHFSEELAKQYLTYHPQTKVLLPEDKYIETQLVRSGLFGQCVFLHAGKKLATYDLSSNIIVQAFQTQHLGSAYDQVPHFCYLISAGSKNILLSADMDYTRETLGQLQGIPIHAAFVNPYFFRALCTRHLFYGQLSAEQFYIYHIPSLSTDLGAMRRMVQRDLLRWEEPGRAEACTTKLQKIYL